MYNNQLGKGLSTLIPNKNDLQNLTSGDNNQGQHIKKIDIDYILPSKNQPRKTFSQEKIEEFAKNNLHKFDVYHTVFNTTEVHKNMTVGRFFNKEHISN